MFRSRKAKLVLAVIMAALAVGIFFGSVQLSDKVPRYLNKSEEQQIADFNQTIDQMVAACHEAGGQWSAGFAQASCSAGKVQADLSWYVAPVENSTWRTLDMLGTLGIVAAILLAMLAMLVLSSAIWPY